MSLGDCPQCWDNPCTCRGDLVRCAKCGSTDLRVTQEAAGTAEPATGDISPGTSAGDRGTPAHPHDSAIASFSVEFLSQALLVATARPNETREQLATRLLGVRLTTATAIAGLQGSDPLPEPDAPYHAVLGLYDHCQNAIRAAWDAFSPHTDLCHATNPRTCRKCAALVQLSECLEQIYDEASRRDG